MFHYKINYSIEIHYWNSRCLKISFFTLVSPWRNSEHQTRTQNVSVSSFSRPELFRRGTLGSRELQQRGENDLSSDATLSRIDSRASAARLSFSLPRGGNLFIGKWSAGNAPMKFAFPVITTSSRVSRNAQRRASPFYLARQARRSL